MSTTVNAPAVEPALGFDDPALEAVEWVTNSSFDDLRDGHHEDEPFSEEELALLPGEGGIDALEHNPDVQMQFGGSGVLDGKRVFIVSVEFFYRNDASREMWGTPAKVEEHIKMTMDLATKAAKEAFACAYPPLAVLGGNAALTYREYMQSNGNSTDDRHVLHLFIPIEKSLCLQTSNNFVDWVKRLLIHP
jgi:hypothetical protein